jgi:hypothetical protein
MSVQSYLEEEKGESSVSQLSVPSVNTVAYT